MRVTGIVVLGMLTLGGWTNARADLIGASVTVTGLYFCSSAGATGPSGCTTFGGPETKTIASGGTTFLSDVSNGVVTVTGSQLIYEATRFCCTAPPQFNGFQFVISGAPAITALSVDPSTTLGPATNNYAGGFLLLAGSIVWMDLNGLSGNAGQRTVFNLTFAEAPPAQAPEPATLGLLALALAATGVARRPRA